MLRPLLQVFDREGIPIYSPPVEIYRLLGVSSGGRLVFLKSDSGLDSENLRSFIKKAIEWTSEIKVQAIHYCIESGESLNIRVILRKPAKMISVKVSEKAFTKIKDENGKEIVSEKLIIKVPE